MANNIHDLRKLTVEYANTNTEESAHGSGNSQLTAECTENNTSSRNPITGCSPMENTRDSRNLPAVCDETTPLLDTRRSSTKYRSLYVILLSIFAALGSFLFGYHVAIVSGSMLFITDTFQLSTLWHSIIVSSTIASAAIFSIWAGILSDLFGRKPVLLASAVLFICGSIIMLIADGKDMLMTGRVFIGMGVGFASMCVPVYIAEIAPPNTRGLLASFNQLFITIGILVSAIIAGTFSSVTDGWRYMLGLPISIGLLYFFGIFLLPESPRYLVAKNQIEKARIKLMKIRGTSQIDDELRDIVNDVRNHTLYTSHGFIRNLRNILKKPTARSALLFGSLLAFFSQFCGINALIYFSGSILRMAGFSSKSAIWLSCIPYGINILGTIIGMVLIEKVGRRPLTLVSFLGVIIALIILAVGFHLSATNSPPVSYIEGLGTCNNYKNCEACITDDGCGFCYVKDQVKTSGSCLPVSDHPERYADSSTKYRCDKTNYNTESSQRKYQWIYQLLCPSDYMTMVVVGLVMFMFAFSPGIGINCWTINAEIYPLWARSTGNSINTSINWIGNLIVSSVFLTLTQTITVYGTFYLFTGITMIGFMVMFVLLPETKDMSLEEVDDLFADSCINKLCGCCSETPTINDPD